MMRIRPRTGMATLGLLAAFAAGEAMAASIEQLVQAGKYKQAYLQGQKQMGAREGDPSFDMAFATAALRGGNAEDAVIALDRVLIVDPNNNEARLLLAEALVRTGGAREARSQLDMISNASPEQSRRVEQLSTALRARESADAVSMRAWVDVALGHDSNVNYGSRHSTTTFFFNQTLPGGPPANTSQKRNLVARQKNQSAWFNRTAVGGSYYRKLGDDKAIDAIATLSTKNNLGEGFDQRAWRANVGYSVRHQNDNVRVALRYEQDDVSSFGGNDRERLRYLWGVIGQITGQGSYAWNRGWETRLTTGMAKIEYPQQRLRDVNQYLLGYEGRKQIGDIEHKFSGYYIYEDPDNGAEFNGRQVFSLNWRGEYNNIAAWKPWVERNLPGLKDSLLPFLNMPVTPYSQFGYTRIQAQDELIAYSETREDNLFDMNLGARWRVSKALNLRANYRYRYTDSSVNVYEYDRSMFEIGLRYSFM